MARGYCAPASSARRRAHQRNIPSRVALAIRARPAAVFAPVAMPP
jgi:hypothetical protein